jgi:hypothetical protein
MRFVICQLLPLWPLLCLRVRHFFCHLFNEDGEGLVKLFKGEKLHQMLLKFAPLCSPSIHNLITSLKHHLGNFGSINYILKLKVLSSYDYI